MQNETELHEIVFNHLNNVYSHAKVIPSYVYLEEWIGEMTLAEYEKQPNEITHGTPEYVYQNSFDYRHWFMQKYFGKYVDAFMKVSCEPNEFRYYILNFAKSNEVPVGPSAAALMAESGEAKVIVTPEQQQYTENFAKITKPEADQENK